LGAQVAHHEPKKKVLIIDIDAQCSLTTVFGQDPITGNDQNVLVLLKGGKAISPASIKKDAFIKKGKYGTGIPANLFLLSGAFEVEDLDYELAQDKTMSKEDFFKQCRRVLALFHDFDYIFVDCPPNKMFLTQGMLRACSHYVVVAIPDKVSTYGIPRLLNWVEQIPIASRPKLIGALINRVIRTGKGITDEQERWLVAIQNTLSKRALLEKTVAFSAFGRTQITCARFTAAVKVILARRTSGNQVHVKPPWAIALRNQPTISPQYAHRPES
jgi:cellulose biosynthesis protein BcsQ